MKTTTMVECFKCSGRGHIEAFSGIANGVCFRCKGVGKVKASIKPEVVKPLNAYQERMIAAITTGDMEGLTFGQLSELRDFAHWPVKQVPNLLAVWRERGEDLFMAAQEEHLEEFYANR